MKKLSQVRRELGFGKFIGGALYLHYSGWGDLEDVARDWRRFIVDAQNVLHRTEGIVGGYTIAKLQPESVSLLEYPFFSTEPFPKLSRSTLWKIGSGAVKVSEWRDNPPILHRKELFVPPSEVKDDWLMLTALLEALGAYEAPMSGMGRLNAWNARLKSLGVNLPRS